MIKEYKGAKGVDLETVGQEDFFETVEQKDLETVVQEDSAHPLAPPRRIQQTVEQEDFETFGQVDYAPPDPPTPPRNSQTKKRSSFMLCRN